MRCFTWFFTGILFASCGPILSVPTINCTASQQADGALIVCPDGSSAVVLNGAQGAVGPSGSSGKSVTGPQGVQGNIGPSGAPGASIVGPQGSPGPSGSPGQSIVGPMGPQGQTGPSGSPGISGSNGLSMVFTTVAADSISCPNGGSTILIALDTSGTGVLNTSDAELQSATVCNGSNGSNGNDGSPGPIGPSGLPGTSASPTPFSIVSLIAPCTQASSPWKEEILCLADGSLLASFSDNAGGLNTRFSLIPTGSYIDTDSSGCNFSVSSLPNGNTSVSWAAGSNQYATWNAQTVTCGTN